MKLAKKMLASVIALAMVAALALTAFAATSSVELVASEAVVGETMTVTVKASGAEGLESAGLFLEYDSSVLQFVEMTESEEKTAPNMVEGGEYEAGKLSLMAAYTRSATEASVELAVYTFNVIAEGDATISYEVSEWVVNGEDLTDTMSAGQIVVKAAEKVVETTTEAPVTTTAEATTAEATTAEATTAEPTEKPESIGDYGEAGVAAVAGVMALAAVAFVVTRKKDAE